MNIQQGDPAFIEFRGAGKSFGSQQGMVEVIAPLDLKIRQGEFVSVVGPSGCGKSTLLTLIAGLQPTSVGDVLVRGERVEGLTPDVGFAFQSDALLPWRTALQNVALPLRCRGYSRQRASAVAHEWLARVGLGPHADKYPHQLSGGMRKRVAIAVMQCYEPDLLLLDEPFSALDVQTRNLMENDLLKICRQLGQTVVLITHDLEEAIVLADRVVVLSAGPARVIADHEVKLADPRDAFESKSDPGFPEIYTRLWDSLRDEVVLAGRRELQADDVETRP